jgi:hypothetical protein
MHGCEANMFMGQDVKKIERSKLSFFALSENESLKLVVLGHLFLKKFITHSNLLPSAEKMETKEIQKQNTDTDCTNETNHPFWRR